MDPSASVEIPVIDLEPARNGDYSVHDTVDDACRRIGFLAIVGHGVPDAQIDEMYAVTKQFFGLPLEEKLRSAPSDPSVFRGYRAPQATALAHSLDEENPPDLVESFVINQIDERSMPCSVDPNLIGFYHPNIWPPLPADLRDVWTRYYETMSLLARDLMRLLAVALDLDKRWFDEKIERHRSNLLANYYPAQLEQPMPGQLRRGAHTDYGGVTVLYQAGRARRPAGAEQLGRLGRHPGPPGLVRYQPRRPDAAMDQRPLEVDDAPRNQSTAGVREVGPADNPVFPHAESRPGHRANSDLCKCGEADTTQADQGRDMVSSASIARPLWPRSSTQ